MDPLDGKVSIITGGGTSIGKGIARAFAGEGARLAIASRKRESLESTADQLRAIGAVVSVVPTDVTEEMQVEAVFAAAIKEHGQIDIPVNNSAVFYGGLIDKLPLFTQQNIMNVNLTGDVPGTRAAMSNQRSQVQVYPEARRSAGPRFLAGARERVYNPGVSRNETHWSDRPVRFTLDALSGAQLLDPIDPLAIAIDGPVASGKTAVGRLLAERLGFRFLDTGLMYRAVALATIRSGVEVEAVESVGRVAREADIRIETHRGQERLVLYGQDVTANLRDTDVEHRVSLVARISAVRSALVAKQRAIAAEGPIVMVGRDIGTVVLPKAPVKVYLKASLEVRARRRYLQLQELGGEAEYERVLEDLERRDKIDSERADSPLRPADNGMQIDTDGVGIEDLAEKIERFVESGGWK